MVRARGSISSVPRSERPHARLMPPSISTSGPAVIGTPFFLQVSLETKLSGELVTRLLNSYSSQSPLCLGR